MNNPGQLQAAMLMVARSTRFGRKKGRSLAAQGLRHVCQTKRLMNLGALSVIKARPRIDWASGGLYHGTSDLDKRACKGKCRSKARPAIRQARLHTLLTCMKATHVCSQTPRVCWEAVNLAGGSRTNACAQILQRASRDCFEEEEQRLNWTRP